MIHLHCTKSMRKMFFLVSDTEDWEEKVPFVIPLF